MPAAGTGVGRSQSGRLDGLLVPDCNGSRRVSDVRLVVLYSKSRRFAPGGFMRAKFLFPLTALVAVAAGCASEARDQASGSVPQRDLTLVPQTPAVEIASPVETHQLRVQHRTVRPAFSSGPLEPKVSLASVTVPLAALGARSAPVLATPEPVAQPVSTAATSPNDRELLPGKTVTVIPASSTPSTGSDGADDLPATRGRAMVAHGGGGCRGRGRGPGIGSAPAPRPDFR